MANITKFDPKSLIQEKRILKDINLLNHIGYFCHDPVKAKQIKEPILFIENINILGEKVEMRYTVSPNVNYGYPSVTAYQICDFIDRFLTYHGRPASNPVPFDMKLLRDFLGLSKTGHNDDTIRNALYQLRHTAVETTHFFPEHKNKWIATTFTVFDDIVSVGEHDEIRGGLIYLNKYFIESFNNKNHIPINYERYEDLSTHSKVLFLELFKSFSAQRRANLHHDFSVEKDYDAICRVLGFKVQNHKSLIKRQLSPHFNALKKDKCALISFYDIQKRARNKGFKISTKPGDGFHKDYDDFNKNPDHLEAKSKAHKNEKDITAIQLVSYFHKKKVGLKSMDETTYHISEKEVNFAKSLLKRFCKAKAINFIDYALNEAVKTNFDMKTFNGVKVYLNQYLAIEQKREEQEKLKKERELVNQKTQQAKQEWDLFLREKYQSYLETLGNQERDEHTKNIKNQALECMFAKQSYDDFGEKGVIYQATISNKIDSFIKDKLITYAEFDEWSKKRGKEDIVGINLKD